MEGTFYRWCHTNEGQSLIKDISLPLSGRMLFLYLLGV